MTTTVLSNQQFRLAARPVGHAEATATGSKRASRYARPADGEILVKTLYLSLDPAMRGWMNEGKCYIRAGRRSAK